jgi:hypothetical protein
LASASGVDISFANKGGLGLSTSGLGELATKIAEFDLAEIQKIDAAGLSLLGKLVPNIGAMLNLFTGKGVTSEQGADAFLALGAKTLRESVSSFSQYEKGLMAFQTHKMMNRRGQVTDRSTSTLEAIFNTIGLNVENSDRKRAMQDSVFEDDKTAKAYGDALARALTTADATGNYKNYQNLIKYFSGIYAEDTEGYDNMMARLRQNLRGNHTRIAIKYFEKTGRFINLEEE